MYGDPVRAHRQAVWDQLIDIGARHDEPWFLVGDFYELMNNEETLGGPVRPEASFFPFRTMVHQCRLKEIISSGNSFSWGGW